MVRKIGDKDLSRDANQRHGTSVTAPAAQRPPDFKRLGFEPLNLANSA